MEDKTKATTHYNLEQAAKRLGFSALTLRRKVKKGRGFALPSDSARSNYVQRATPY